MNMDAGVKGREEDMWVREDGSICHCNECLRQQEQHKGPTMIGIPWVALREAIMSMGFFPLLGFPSNIDPYRCVFRIEEGCQRAEAIYKGFIIAEWDPTAREWRDLR